MFKVGEEVKIIKKIGGYDTDITWVSLMDKTIGQITVIKAIFDSSVILSVEIPNCGAMTWVYDIRSIESLRKIKLEKILCIK